jgi:membrane protease YdiL (CAAX protease family)
MNLIGKKSKAIYLVETVFIFLLSQIIAYCTLLFSSKANLFELSNNIFPLWRYNPFLTIPHLAASILGLAILPVVWEKAVRNTGLQEIGLFIPHDFFKEFIYGAALLVIFILYRYMLTPKHTGIFNLSPYIILLMFICWIVIALGEEILYRGVIQRRLFTLLGTNWGLVLASIMFAFAGHSGEPWINNLVFRLPFGLILGYLYLRSQSILIPIFVHWAFNFFFAI